MEKYTVEKFLSMVKTKRAEKMSPYELVYKSFGKLGYDKQDTQFFRENASIVVENLRQACWKNYLPEEEFFTSEMLKLLIEENEIRGKEPKEALESFIDTYPTHIYQLCLSNTQSRRSRAGKEFEAILELLLIGADIPLDSQGNIGKKIFTEKGLGKLVDFVSPGVVEYLVNKNDTVLISAKTTLRERWQEVPEEMSRTGAREMFLATLDEEISKEVLETLYEANIRVTTTKENKAKNYPQERRIVDFEQLLQICTHYQERWSLSNFSKEEKVIMAANIDKQLQKHENHAFVFSYYERKKRLLQE